MNTLNLALRQGQGSGWSIRHCASLPERVVEARRTLGLITRRLDRFQLEIKALRQCQVTGRQLVNYFDVLLPQAQTDRQKIRRDEVITSFRANFEDRTNTLPGIRGSAWAAYNAVSEWSDHQRTFRGATSDIKRQRRLDSIWFGASNQLKQDAWAGALELAGLQ